MNQPNAISRTDDFEFAALGEARNYRAALLAVFEPFLRGDVVEVGAGIGQISEIIHTLPMVASLVSVEPENRFCEKFRTLHPGLNLLEGTVDDLGFEQDRDAILSINVLEHIGEDQTELGKYRRLLARKRGHLCLLVPACPELYAPLDRDFGHFRRYTMPGLARQLREAGFEVTALQYFNCVGYLAWWLSFCVLKKRSFNAGAVRLYDRMIFPPVHAFERRVMRPPLGQSLFAVARSTPM